MKLFYASLLTLGISAWCAFSNFRPAPAPKAAAPAFKAEDLFRLNLCDGFAFPFGDGNGGGNYKGFQENATYQGWYVATKTGETYTLGIHTGEDWNGNGGGNTELGQPVYATAAGEVIDAQDFGAPWGNVVYIKHQYLENAQVKTVYSLYAHMEELKVKKGAVVSKRQIIGSIGTGHKSFPAHLHFEIRKENMTGYETTYWPSTHKQSVEWVMAHYEEPSAFIRSHKKLLVPSNEDVLLVAVKHDYKLYLYKKGTLAQTYPIALSQSPVGHKQKEGDNKLPEGEYKIIQKTKGPFEGAYSQYLGERFMRLNYPNNTDASIAYDNKRISKAEFEQIVKANNTDKEPNKNTGLGGGIGIHGWAGDWPASTKDLTWGCISMQNKQLLGFYDAVPMYTRILIYP